MKKYLIKSSAFTLALAMVLGLASCKDDVQVETATDVAAVESVSDIVTTASTTSQTEATTEVVTEIVTDAQGNTQVVTVTQAEGATTAKSDTKVSTNGDTKASPATKATAKTTKKTTTVKATTKSTAKATTKATTKATSSSEKPAGKGDERAVAKAVIKWINYYRQQQGKPAAIEMPGKATQFAQGRSKQLVTNFAHDDDDATDLVMAILKHEGREIIKEAPANEWEIVDNKVNIVVYNAERELIAEHSWKGRAKKKEVAPKEPEMTEEEKMEAFQRAWRVKMEVDEQNFRSDRRMLFFHLFLMVVAGGLTAWLGYYLEWSATKIWIFSVGMGAYFTQLWWCNDKRAPLGVAAPFERRCQYRPWINGGWIVATIVAGGLLALTYIAGTLEENLDDIVTSWFIFIPVFTLVFRVTIGSTKPAPVLMAEEWFSGFYKSVRKMERR
ncbi:MAG: hypothetical protein UHT63_02180, partial [Acutalibacteraceae bacterium]|nr:hypothetical protein [Acutalibacteraceae bacterium]